MRKRVLKTKLHLASYWEPSSLAIVLAGIYGIIVLRHRFTLWRKMAKTQGFSWKVHFSGARRHVHVATNRLYVCHAASWLHFFSAERYTPAR